jgi:hypothetical protein
MSTFFFLEQDHPPHKMDTLMRQGRCALKVNFRFLQPFWELTGVR